MRRLNRYLTRHLHHVRRDPLRRYIYLLLWPWFVPAVSYLIFGHALLADAGSLLGGLAVVLFLSTVANELDTYALTRIIRRFPAHGQSGLRLAWMIVLFSLLNVLLAEASLRLFDLTHFLNYAYPSEGSLRVPGFVVVAGVVAAGLVECAYAFMQWQSNLMEKQTLEREHVRAQLDALKSRINPHFLFNSLNAVSALIGEDPRQAEAFVDELSKVYRHLLQANRQPLVPLDAEIRFVESYGRLLKARFGDALRIGLHIHPLAAGHLLPPVSLQVLLDDIIQHNVLMPGRPLAITLETVGPDRLWIRYNRQPRTVLLDRDLPGLEAVVLQYRPLTDEPVLSEHTAQQGNIGLPLLRVASAPPAFPSIQP